MNFIFSDSYNIYNIKGNMYLQQASVSVLEPYSTFESILNQITALLYVQQSYMDFFGHTLHVVWYSYFPSLPCAAFCMHEGHCILIRYCKILNFCQGFNFVIFVGE